MFFKLHDEDNDEYYETDFLQKKVKNCLSVKSIRCQMQMRGISSKKKNAIIDNLSSLLPSDRKPFYENLPLNENSADLISERE